jgi:serine/threonine-protein kinase
MSEKGRRLIGIIDEASTVIERRPDKESEDSEVTRKSPPKKEGPTDVLHRATDALPSIAVPPFAERMLESTSDQIKPSSTEENTAPRIGEYALIARFPSSATAEVFLGYKTTNFGFIRRAVVKWTDRCRYDYELIRQKLLDEARAISFIDHPNIVSIIDLAEDDLGTYVALEYVAGTDLRRVIVELTSRKDRMPTAHVCHVMTEILRGLSHVHLARGPNSKPLNISHRDVNPSNILISTDGHVKLTDFGAVLMDGRFQDSTAPGTVKGKVRYLAPEYIQTQEATPQVDVYGVGLMMFELLTGRPAFMLKDETTAMVKIVREGVPIYELDELNTPRALVGIVARATARAPAERYATAVEMCQALEDFMASEGMFVSPTRLAAYLSMHGLYI